MDTLDVKDDIPLLEPKSSGYVKPVESDGKDEMEDGSSSDDSEDEKPKGRSRKPVKKSRAS